MILQQLSATADTWMPRPFSSRDQIRQWIATCAISETRISVSRLNMLNILTKHKQTNQ